MLGFSVWVRLWLVELLLVSWMIFVGIKIVVVINVGFVILGVFIGVGGYG